MAHPRWLLFAFSPFLLGASSPQEPRRPDVLGTTYETRCAQQPLMRPAAAPALVLPHTTVAWLPPGRMGAGPLPAWRKPDASPLDPAHVIWQRVPWVDGHAEWLTYRATRLEESQGNALVDWCEQRGLRECAAYELRRLMQARTAGFDQPDYRRINERWIACAAQQQVPWNFPLPCDGVWDVLKDANGHHRIPFKQGGAAFAYDLVIRRGGKSCTGTGRRLEDYHAWDQPILAQADGVVSRAEGGHPDAAIGRSGGFDKANMVEVDYGAGVLGLYAHLKQGSVTVKAGDQVQAGQTLGRVGNSGASGMPHLHVTFLDRSAFSIPGRYRIEVQDAGGWALQADQDLREGSTVRNPPSNTK